MIEKLTLKPKKYSMKWESGEFKYDMTTINSNLDDNLTYKHDSWKYLNIILKLF